jgi:hypothetical protein
MYKILETRFQLISLYYNITKNFAQQYEHRKSLQKFIRVYFTEHWIRITIEFHVLLKWNQNNKIKYMVCQNRICGFLLQNILNYTYFPKTMYLRISSFSLDLPSLGSPKSHHHDSKPTRFQNSNLQCSMNSPYFKCLVHPNHAIILTP